MAAIPPLRHQAKIGVACLHGQAHCLPESCPKNGELPKSLFLSIGSLIAIGQHKFDL
jgi:hypothetical protein